MSYDIFTVYQSVQNLINEIETKSISVSDGIFHLTNKFDILINEIQSFLIYSYDYYYGYFLINLKLHYRFENNFVAGVTFSPGYPVLMINPMTLGKMKLKEIIFVLCHEIEHLVLAHHVELLRMNKNNDPQLTNKFNLACDASVNDRLNLSIAEGFDLLECPNGLVTSETIGSMVNKKVLYNQHFLYYYDLIKDCQDDLIDGSTMFDDINYELDFDDDNDNDNADSNNNNNNNDNNDNNDKNDNNANNNNSHQNRDSKNGTQNKISICSEDLSSSVTSSNATNYNTFGDLSPVMSSAMDAEAVEEIFNNYIENTLSSMSEKARGLFCGQFEELIRKIKQKPIISWKKELRKFLGIIPCGQRKTIMRLNRRQPNRIDLRGKMADKTFKLVIAIDTSGSMDEKTLSIILNEISQIVKSRKTEITIIECDEQINKIYKVKSLKNIQYKLSGRGGTYFSPVIQYVNNNKYYRDCLLIYFTDGYGEHKIPKPLIYRMLWFVFGTYLSVNNKYGSRIFVDETKLEVIKRVNG